MDPHGAHPEDVDTVWKRILKALEEDNVSRVIVVGEAGMGKTWMARKICEHATKESSFYMTLWLNLNKELDEMSLYEDISSQLFVFHKNEESDGEDSDEDNIEDEEEQKNRDLMQLKEKIREKLMRKKLNRKDRNYFLLVLDDEGSVTNEEKVMKELYLEKFLASYGPLRMLLARRKEEEEDDAVDSDAELHASPDPDTIYVPLTLGSTYTDNWLRMLLTSLNVSGLFDSLEKAWGKDDGFLENRIVEMSMGLPAAVVVLVKSLNCISRKRPVCLSPKQKDIIKIAVLSSVPPGSSFHYRGVQSPDRKRARSRHNPILRLAYELLETDDAMKSCIVDCFWHSLSFFEYCGCVYYQELIAHWILEGYFDPVRSVKKAYKDGHAILMELKNRGFLKTQEDNVVVPEVAMKNLIDLRRRGLSGTSRIGLAKVFGTDVTKGLGKINQVDDIMEAVQESRKGEKITTILVSGNRLRRENPEKFFEKLKDLEVLGLFEPTLDPFVPPLLKLVKLRVLVIRDCDLLDSIEELKALRGLNVLEVSGASSLKKISDDFFKALSKLQSLHLSGLRIRSSPPSISELTELHCLIIKDCPLLEDLPDIQELVKLEVVDISGARGLQTCFDNTPGEKKNHSKNKNFYHLTQLQLLDLSESQIERLPMFHNSAVADKLHSLTRLLLRDCSQLRKLPNLKPLSGLQILDLSGTASLMKMMDVCFEDKQDLRILNLSGTNLRQLPSTIEELSNLSELLVRDCLNLEVLPNIEKLTNLEVVDVSGCTKLHTVEGSFEYMSYLREVSLSNTKVRFLPELPKESKLCCRKRILLADFSRFEGEKWSEIKEKIERERSENADSSEAIVESLEISKKDSEEIGEIQSNDFRVSDCTERGDVSEERILQVPIDRDMYKNILLLFDSASQQEVMTIHEAEDLCWEALANAEFVSFVDISSTRLGSIFDNIISVKGCWLSMCMDIKDLFSGVDEDRLGSLETLSITNLPLLDSISCGGSFKNLKKLSIDCCPNIKTVFREASQLPSSLEFLNLKYCEKLEKVVEGVELSTISNLTVEKENCPNFKEARSEEFELS